MYVYRIDIDHSARRHLHTRPSINIYIYRHEHRCEVECVARQTSAAHTCHITHSYATLKSNVKLHIVVTDM